MAKHLPKSKHGEGVGGPVQETDDPNNPSFDPATHETATDRKIRYLVASYMDAMSDWEKQFVMSIYGQVPLTRNQHIRVGHIYDRLLGSGASKE